MAGLRMSGGHLIQHSMNQDTHGHIPCTLPIPSSTSSLSFFKCYLLKGNNEMNHSIRSALDMWHYKTQAEVWRKQLLNHTMAQLP